MTCSICPIAHQLPLQTLFCTLFSAMQLVRTLSTKFLIQYMHLTHSFVADDYRIPVQLVLKLVQYSSVVDDDYLLGNSLILVVWTTCLQRPL